MGGAPPSRDWTESGLSEDHLKREVFFNPEPICAKWRENLSGTRRSHYYLWDMLMFQAWYEQHTLTPAISIAYQASTQ